MLKTTSCISVLRKMFYGEMPRENHLWFYKEPFSGWFSPLRVGTEEHVFVTLFIFDPVHLGFIFFLVCQTSSLHLLDWWMRSNPIGCPALHLFRKAVWFGTLFIAWEGVGRAKWLLACCDITKTVNSEQAVFSKRVHICGLYMETWGKKVCFKTCICCKRSREMLFSTICGLFKVLMLGSFYLFQP